MSTRKVALSALVVMSLGFSTANAAVLFENPFSGQNTGWFSSSSTSWRVYDNFTLSLNSTLTGFEFSTYSSDYVPSTFDVTIFSDNTFSTLLFSQSYGIGDATTAADGSAIRIAVDLPDWDLAAGTYWISPYGTSGHDLALNITSPTLDGSLIQSGEARLNDMAMIITGTQGQTVPEPATLAIMGLGLAGLALSRRKSKQQ